MRRAVRTLTEGPGHLGGYSAAHLALIDAQLAEPILAARGLLVPSGSCRRADLASGACAD